MYINKFVGVLSIKNWSNLKKTMCNKKNILKLALDWNTSRTYFLEICHKVFSIGPALRPGRFIVLICLFAWDLVPPHIFFCPHILGD